MNTADTREIVRSVLSTLRLIFSFWSYPLRVVWDYLHGLNSRIFQIFGLHIKPRTFCQVFLKIKNKSLYITNNLFLIMHRNYFSLIKERIMTLMVDFYIISINTSYMNKKKKNCGIHVDLAIARCSVIGARRRDERTWH